jgi:hypothetical protein
MVVIMGKRIQYDIIATQFCPGSHLPISIPMLTKIIEPLLFHLYLFISMDVIEINTGAPQGCVLSAVQFCLPSILLTVGAYQINM